MKFLLYSILFLVSLILPAFIVSSYILKKEPPGRDYVVTYCSGDCSFQYNTQHDDQEFRKYFSDLSDGAKMAKGMITGPGDRIKTGKGSFADIMKKGSIAIRISENSQVDLSQKDDLEGPLELNLKQGKVICRVNKADKETLKVKTGSTQVTVKGTIFYVEILPEQGTTYVSVLEGTVNIETFGDYLRNFDVKAGKKTEIDPYGGGGEIKTIADFDQESLLKIIKEIQTDESSLKSVYNAIDMDVFSPVLNKIVSKITESEMRTFVKEMKFIARHRKGGKLPSSIKEVELEEGDHSDPWNTDYVYERINFQKGIIISAGPDKTLHTRDDIMVTISF